MMETFSVPGVAEAGPLLKPLLLADTNIWIGLENAEFDATELTPFESRYILATHATVIGELKLGVELAVDALKRDRREKMMQSVIRMPLLDQSIEVALRYGILCAHVRQSGAMRQRSNDLWLAAAAHVHKASILTLNPRDFDDLPGLKVHALQRVSKTVAIKRS